MGNREKFLKNAIQELSNIIKIEKKSSIYESKAVEYEDQDDFLNMAIKGRTKLSAKGLIEKIKEIEKKLGREKTIDKGPRKIDIDILFYNEEIIEEEGLKIPHPAIQERSFVLEPLAEIEGEFIHPKLKETINTLLIQWTKKK